MNQSHRPDQINFSAAMCTLCAGFLIGFFAGAGAAKIIMKIVGTWQ